MNNFGVSEQLSFGGVGLPGYALAGPGDPEVYSKLTPEQQKWVIDTLVRLNDLIIKTTGAHCPTWGPSVPAAAGCFQLWWNNTVAVPGAPVMKLRLDGVFDQSTLDALITTTQIHDTDFPVKFPTQKKGLSGVAKAGIAVGAVAALGGIALLVTKKKSRRGRGRRG